VLKCFREKKVQILSKIFYFVWSRFITAKQIWDSSIFFLLNQNLTFDRLLMSVFLPINLTDFAWSEHIIVLNIKKKNNFRFWSGNSGKNTEINKQSHVTFWFNRKKYGAVSYLLSCTFNENCKKEITTFAYS
jgi:hypothetical protein